jgi:hypothetical protein
MTDALPAIEMDFSPGGAPVVIVETVEVTDPAAILPLAPDLTKPEWVFAYTALVNHLAQGARFEPIYDPEEFKAAYMAKYDAEDPNEAPDQGVNRLHDFGIPDFAAITAPHMEGETLVFFAENTYMGIPYRATMAPGQQPDYQPVAIVE